MVVRFRLSFTKLGASPWAATSRSQCPKDEKDEICICIYIYIYRERERYTHTYIYIYIYICKCVCVHMFALHLCIYTAPISGLNPEGPETPKSVPVISAEASLCSCTSTPPTSALAVFWIHGSGFRIHSLKKFRLQGLGFRV